MDFTKKKKVKIDRIGKLFRSCPIIPLFGDIAINVGSILMKSPHWKTTKYDFNNLEGELKQELKMAYLISYNIKNLQKTHKVVLSTLQHWRHQVRFFNVD